MEITKAEITDADEILELQKLAYQSEAKIYNDFSIPPLHQTLEEIKNEFANQIFLKAVINNNIVGSVRAYREKNTCFIGRLITHPDYQNQGIGTELIQKIEAFFGFVDRFELFTGYKSKKNLYLYQKLGYNIYKTEDLNENIKLHYLEKLNSKSMTEKIKDHFEKISSNYDNMISSVVPYYYEMLSAMIKSIPFDREQKFDIIDLGCGTGNLSKLIKIHFPNSKLISLDISENMIKLAKEKLSEYKDIEYMVEDFNSLSFTTKFDAIISSFAIHHLQSDKEKKDFYTKIYNALNHEGVFYNLDVIKGPNEYLQEMYVEQWKDFLKNNYNQNELYEILADHYREDNPAILFNQLKWLEQIGFKNVDVIWKCYYFSVYGGIK